MAEKNSFILHLKYGSIFAEMSNKQAGVLIKAIFNYIATGETMEGLNDVEVKTAFKFIKLDLDFATAKYEYTCAQNSLNGKRGGAPKGNSNAKKQPKQANGCFETDRLKNNPIDVDSDKEKEKKALEEEKEKAIKEKEEVTQRKEKEIFAQKGLFGKIEEQEKPLDLNISFAWFWEKYPKKTTKKQCFDWWKKNPGKRQAAIDGLEYYKRSTDAQYYLDPIRYLKRERWLDKPENWQEARAAAKPQEPQISAEERAEQERWNSLTEEERKAELDVYMAESGGPWKPGG